MSADNSADACGGYLPRLGLWLRWRWHHVRWWRRGADWFFLHSYGCDACEAHE